MLVYPALFYSVKFQIQARAVKTPLVFIAGMLNCARIPLVLIQKTRFRVGLKIAVGQDPLNAHHGQKMLTLVQMLAAF